MIYSWIFVLVQCLRVRSLQNALVCIDRLSSWISSAEAQIEMLQLHVLINNQLRKCRFFHISNQELLSLHLSFRAPSTMFNMVWNSFLQVNCGVKISIFRKMKAWYEHLGRKIRKMMVYPMGVRSWNVKMVHLIKRVKVFWRDMKLILS